MTEFIIIIVIARIVLRWEDWDKEANKIMATSIRIRTLGDGNFSSSAL